MIIVNKTATPQELQDYIGYKFHDGGILEEALTRRAFLNENLSDNEHSMDTLATLGDAILDAVVVYKLYEEGIRQKGVLTVDKSDEVKRAKTRRFAEKHQLHTYIQWGKGEKQDEIWSKGDLALDTVFEALIGAVFLDAHRHKGNGIPAVTEMLGRLKYFD